MDSRRAETLEALSAYLQHQRSLLARTQADIERLKTLREEISASPEHLTNRSNFQDNDTPTTQLPNVSDLQDYHPDQSFQSKIDWQAFSASDPTPLRTLAIRTRIDYTQRTVPANTQRSPLSFLQKFVKDARKAIIDPVFDNLSTSTNIGALSNPTVTSNPHVNSPSSDDHNPTPHFTLLSSLSEDEKAHQQTPIVQDTVRRRDRARPKTRELKKRKMKTDLVIGCKLGEEGSNHLPIRNDLEDESMDVDISGGTPQPCPSASLDGSLDQMGEPIDADDVRAPTLEDSTWSTKLPKLPRARQHIDSPRDGSNRSSRTRKPSLKLQSQFLTARNHEPSPTSVLPIPSQSLGKRCRDVAYTNDTAPKPKSDPLSLSGVNTEADQNRSDTYKQSWSISEQHLLERLLEEIPDGERNRWAKISQAMGGRRTPRQVASRVQKYFEKLKRFGVSVDKKNHIHS